MGARAEHGFTLMEVLVSTGLAIVIFIATLSLFDAFQRNNRVDIIRNEIQDTARNATDRLARELRNVAAPTTGSAGALEQAEPYSIAFQTINPNPLEKGSLNNTNAMRVRYCLNDSTPTDEVLYRQVETWKSKEYPALPASTACPDLINGDWGTTTQLVQHITNEDKGQKRALFTFGPSGASEVGQIIFVEPTIYVDLTPGEQPGETVLTSGIFLRNANRTPIATFTATVVNEHVKLNASESTDPDGLALTYKWKEGATELPTTAQQYETPEKLAKGSHTFTLEVSDPGGLKASASQAVTV